MDTHGNELAEPFLGNQIHIRLAYAGRNSGDQPVTMAAFESGQGTAVNIRTTPPVIADGFASFNTDQRRSIAQASQPGGHIIRDEMAVGEEHEVAIRMCSQDLEKPWMQERLPSQNPEKAVAMLLCLIDYAIDIVCLQPATRHFYINPTALTSQIAVGCYGKEQKRRKILAPFQPPFVRFH
jgi:hypothetical protein